MCHQKLVYEELRHALLKSHAIIKPKLVQRHISIPLKSQQNLTV